MSDDPAPPLIARDDGVGPLTADSELALEALEAAFAGRDVEAIEIDHGDDLRERYVAVRECGQLLLKIVGDVAIDHVAIVSDAVANPFGVRLGMTHAEVANLVGPLACADAALHTDWKHAIVECTSDASDRFGFDFELPGEDADDLLANPALLATATLVGLRWQPYGPLGPR